MYSDEEILEHLTEGEGRGFLGRSMYDAIIGEIEQLTISLQAQEELTTSWYNKTKQQNDEIERLNNIIDKIELALELNIEDLKDNYEMQSRIDEDKEILRFIKELKGSDKE